MKIRIKPEPGLLFIHRFKKDIYFLLRNDETSIFWLSNESILEAPFDCGDSSDGFCYEETMWKVVGKEEEASEAT